MSSPNEETLVVNPVQTIKAGQEIERSRVREINGKTYVVLRASSGGENLHLVREETDGPRRMRGCSEFDDLPSFAAFFKRFASDKTVVCMTYGDRMVVTATFNFEDGWGDFEAILILHRSRECKAWIGNNTTPFTQRSFAEFLEEHADEVVEPDSATLLEVARNLKATKKVNFQEGTNLQNGAISLEYKEEVEGTAGQLQIPEGFVVELPAFLRDDSIKIRFNARFRYSIDDGRLKLSYRLIRHEQASDLACDVMAQMIEAEIGTKPLRGEVGTPSVPDFENSPQSA